MTTQWIYPGPQGIPHSQGPIEFRHFGTKRADRDRTSLLEPCKVTWPTAETMWVLRCPNIQCRKHLLVGADGNSAGVPPYDALFYCPICGTMLRDKPGRYFFGESPSAMVMQPKAPLDLARCDSPETRYCIQTGGRLSPQLLFHPDSSGLYQPPERGLPFVFSGATVDMVHVRFRNGSVPWGLSPIAHLRDTQGPPCEVRLPSIKPLLGPDRQPGYRVTLPQCQGWRRISLWFLDADASQPKYCAEAYLVPMPDLAFRSDKGSYVLLPSSQSFSVPPGTSDGLLRIEISDFPRSALPSDSRHMVPEATEAILLRRARLVQNKADVPSQEPGVFPVRTNGPVTLHPWAYSVGFEPQDARDGSGAVALPSGAPPPSPSKRKGPPPLPSRAQTPKPMAAALPSSAPVVLHGPPMAPVPVGPVPPVAVPATVAVLPMPLIEWQDCVGNWHSLAQKDPTVVLLSVEESSPDDPVKLELRASIADPFPLGLRAVHDSPPSPSTAEIPALVPSKSNGRWTVQIPAAAIKRRRSLEWSLGATGFRECPLRVRVWTAKPGVHVFNAESSWVSETTWFGEPSTAREISLSSLAASDAPSLVGPALMRVEVLAQGGQSVPAQGKGKGCFSAAVPAGTAGRLLIRFLYEQCINAPSFSLHLLPASRQCLQKSVTWGEAPGIKENDENLDIGIPARPNLAAKLEKAILVEVDNAWGHEIRLSPDWVFDESGEKLVKACLCPKDCRDGSGKPAHIALPSGKSKLPVYLVPQRADGARSWNIRFPVVAPAVGAAPLLQLDSRGVGSELEPTRIYYDFGTTFTSVRGLYAKKFSDLREPVLDLRFVRSRGVALWDWERDTETYPDSVQAPISDSELASTDFANKYCAYAVVDQIKSAFRIGHPPLVPVQRLRASVKVRKYQPRTAREAFDLVQESLAAHVVKELRIWPGQILTALPIVLRGRRRTQAIDAIGRGFGLACRSEGWPDPTVDAELDESSAAGMEALYRVATDTTVDLPRYVLVIDVGGGTTDITLFCVSPDAPGAVPQVACVGFDGLGRGGEWATDCVLAILEEQCRAALKSGADARRLALELGLSDALAAALEEHGPSALRPIAERAKRHLQSPPFGADWMKREWQPGPADPASPSTTGVPATPGHFKVTWQAFLGSGYEKFVAEVVARAMHAGNVTYSPNFVAPYTGASPNAESPPPILDVVLAGQASLCPLLADRIKSALGVTLSDPGADAAEQRKRAVVRGLATYCSRVRGTRLQAGFRVGGLEDTVLLPVGVPGWGSVVIPKMSPLRMPWTLYGPEEVWFGRGDRPVEPVVRIRPDVTSEWLDEAKGLSNEIVTTEQDIRVGRDLQQPGDATATMLRDLQSRFRYCLWIDEDDSLYGALYEKWQVEDGTLGPPAASVSGVDGEAGRPPRSEATRRTFSWRDYAHHPVLLLLRATLQEGGKPLVPYSLGAQRMRQPASAGDPPMAPLRHRDATGRWWTTYTVPMVKVRDPKSPWYLERRGAVDGVYVGLAPEDLLEANDMGPGERHSWFPLTFVGDELREVTTYDAFARSVVRWVSGRPLSGNLPVVEAVLLPESVASANQAAPKRALVPTKQAQQLGAGRAGTLRVAFSSEGLEDLQNIRSTRVPLDVVPVFVEDEMDWYVEGADERQPEGSAYASSRRMRLRSQWWMPHVSPSGAPEVHQFPGYRACVRESPP